MNNAYEVDEFLMIEDAAKGSKKPMRWGYHIVDQKTGNSVPNTPKFKSRKEAYQFLKNKDDFYV